MFYLLYISQALGVQQNEGVVCLLRVRHTPHPDSLGVRLHRGSNRETCKGSGEVVTDEGIWKLEMFLTMELGFEENQMCTWKKRQPVLLSTTVERGQTKTITWVGNLIGYFYKNIILVKF